jgi:hypothetical protein
MHSGDSPYAGRHGLDKLAAAQHLGTETLVQRAVHGVTPGRIRAEAVRQVTSS